MGERSKKEPEGARAVQKSGEDELLEEAERARAGSRRLDEAESRRRMRAST